jgi:NAD(P)-dependent dehydrogenase (short-subunit alcohol dehydrogenase family)
VNNAGANPQYSELSKITEDVVDKIINVNLKPALFLSQAVFNNCMKQHGGSIINVSTVGAVQCVSGINAYNVVKAALNHVTRCLASEWGEFGVRVNALAPGLIKTDFSKMLWENPLSQKTIAKQPIARIGTVDDMIGAALLLATGASAFITGVTLTADGGQLVQSRM